LDRTEWAEWPEHDRKGRTAETNNHNRAATTGQPEQDIQGRSVRAGQSGKVGLTGQPGQVILDRLGKKGRQEHDSKDIAADGTGQVNVCIANKQYM
jgi:hypothetical protein